jgi:predicted lipoprotein with Yx(FWY)xxD motif
MVSFSKFLIPVVVGASLLAAACGGSSKSSNSGSAYGGYSPSSSSPASSSSSGLTIGTAKGSAGTYLVGASGRALYLWVADSNGKSSCAGSCASVWPPLTASSMPNVTGGASAADVSLIARPNGTKQVAYKGHPLYYFAADKKAGMTTGQGSNSFGAKWWLVAPSGGQLTSASSSSSSSNSSSGGSSSGGSSGSSWG